MLKAADIVVITKGDVVSQAEREVFAARVRTANPKAVVLHVGGLSGQGAYELGRLLWEHADELGAISGRRLRFPMPSALCSYCLGETRIGREYQLGNVRQMSIQGESDVGR
jgi:Ni2+-binding GTPase involved in maturation of urease and hydrogenase